jgi:uncharacterized membrane protein
MLISNVCYLLSLKFITTEKEKQLKEAMKIMGLANWLHWTAWFVKCILFLIVTITCMVVLLTVSSFFSPYIPHETSQ